MSEVPHSIFGRLQSLPQRVLPRSHYSWLTGGIHAVLLLREISNRQMEVGRGENLWSLENSLWSRLRHTRRSLPC